MSFSAVSCLSQHIRTVVFPTSHQHVVLYQGFKDLDAPGWISQKPEIAGATVGAHPTPAAPVDQHLGCGSPAPWHRAHTQPADSGRPRRAATFSFLSFSCTTARMMVSELWVKLSTSSRGTWYWTATRKGSEINGG